MRRDILDFRRAEHRKPFACREYESDFGDGRAEKDKPGDYNVVHLDSTDEHHRSVISTFHNSSVHIAFS